MSSLGYQDVVALPDGRLAYVRDDDGPAVTCDLDGIRRWRVVVLEPFLQLRAGFCGILAVIGKGNSSGHALVTFDGGTVADFGPTFGDNSVCVGPDGLYICRSDTRIDVVSPSGVLLRIITAAVGSQGIRDVVPETGEIRIGDQWHARIAHGVTLFQPCERGGVMVGQADPPQIAGSGPVGLFTARVGFGFEPHVCALPGARYAVCARPWAAPVLVPPYPPFEDGHEPPEPPMPEPTLPADVCATLHAEFAKYQPAPMGDQLGLVLNATAWQHRPDWGLSRKVDGVHVDSPAGPIAHDILHRRSDNRIWDVIVSAGAPSASVSCGTALGVQTDPARPWVAPVNPDGGPTPPTPPSDDLERRVEALELRMAALEQSALRYGARVGLRTHDGVHVVCAEGGGGREVNATRTGVGPWETFTVERP